MTTCCYKCIQTLVPTAYAVRHRSSLDALMMIHLPCREAKEELERTLNVSSTQAAQPSSQSNAWAAFTNPHAGPATAAAQPRPTASSLGGDAAAWGSRPRPAAANSAWGAATAAPACTLHTGLRQARAAEAQPQPHLHAQPAACSSSSGSEVPDQGSDSGSAPLPSPARAARVQTSWNPQPRERQQRRASHLFTTQQGGSLPTSYAAAARSQPSTLPASAPQPADRLGGWHDAVPPSPPLDRRADRHPCSSWSPSWRRSQLPTYGAGAPTTSPPQSQRGWLPPPRVLPPPAAVGGMFADDVGYGPSSPVMCSLPDSSQHGAQGISGRSGGCVSPIALETSDSEGAAAALGVGSAPADVLDDEGAPLAEFHWASQARSSMSQPLPGGRRRSSITTGGRPGGHGLGDEHECKFERSTPQRQPLQAAAKVSEWLHSTSSSPLQQRGGAAARLGGDGQNMLLRHPSPDSSKSRSADSFLRDCQGSRSFDRLHARHPG